MIKIGLRNNLLYPSLLIIFTFLRRVLLVIISDILEFESSLSFLAFLMIFSEFIVGLIIYLYQSKIVSYQKMAYKDSKFKVYILIFIATFFDFVEFILTSYYFPKFENISKSLDLRLGSALTLSSFIFSYFLLKTEVFNHQKFSISIIFICTLIIIIVEISFYIFYEAISKRHFIIILLIIISLSFIGFQNNIEKYLLEVNFINPFHLLMVEGIFGILLSIIYSFIEDPIENIVDFYHNNKKINFIYLVICLSLFIILSGGRNGYKILTIRLYSPMTKAISDFFFNPILIIYYFFMGIDFKFENKKNILFFMLNLILSIIIVFFGCVYSELFIIYHFNLERDTHMEVSIRASLIEDMPKDKELLLMKE